MSAPFLLFIYKWHLVTRLLERVRSRLRSGLELGEIGIGQEKQALDALAERLPRVVAIDLPEHAEVAVQALRESGQGFGIDRRSSAFPGGYFSFATGEACLP